MAQTRRKPVYILPQHHDILRRIAYEQRCNLADVLDCLLESVDWEEVSSKAGAKTLLKLTEKSSARAIATDSSSGE
jgi:fatty acid desaturase